MLHRAALIAMRSAGRVEPNPMVGCIIGTSDGRVLGMGHHQEFGGPHAEVMALRDAQSRGVDVRGACAWVTLEPCSHIGKTGPCVEALRAAGIGRVVFARRDPGAESGGGASVLEAAGIRAELNSQSPLATHLSDPFVKRVRTQLPWVIAKWAQTIDGRIATRTGASQWISNATSRRRVHTLRARIDAVLTGIGTVLADDPQLTARGVVVRRTAKRIIIDPRLELPLDCALVQSASSAPVIVATTSRAMHDQAARAAALCDRGVLIVVVPGDTAEVDCASLLRLLVKQHDVSTVMVESGAGLLGRMLAQQLIDEAWVFIAPMVLADEEALPAARGCIAPSLTDAARFRLMHTRRIEDDVLLRYARPFTDDLP